MSEVDWVANKQLGFLDVGAGETLVFLHAFPLRGAMWRHQVAAFGRKYRVIVPDLPGFGQSETIQPWSSPMDRMGDAIAELLENLRLPRAVYCGCSMGGYVALQLAQRYPERVRGLVLSNSRASADSTEAKNGRELTARKVQERGMAALEPMADKMLGAQAGAALHDEVLAMIRSGNREGAAAASRGIGARTETLSFLARFDAPVLVLHGAQDALVSRDESEAMVTAAKRGELTVIDGAGHLAPLEQPSAWNDALAGWLARLPR